MKDKQSSTRRLPKCLILNSCPCHQGCRFAALADTQCGACVCVPYFDLEKAEQDKMKVGGFPKNYLLLVVTLPGFAGHAITGVPMSCSLARTAVFMSEEAAGWGLPGCGGTERRLWHPRYSLEIQQICNKTLKMGALLRAVAINANSLECVCWNKIEKCASEEI